MIGIKRQGNVGNPVDVGYSSLFTRVLGPVRLARMGTGPNFCTLHTLCRIPITKVRPRFQLYVKGL